MGPVGTGDWGLGLGLDKNTKEHEMRTRNGEFIKLANVMGTRYLKSATPSIVHAKNAKQRYKISKKL